MEGLACQVQPTSSQAGPYLQGVLRQIPGGTLTRPSKALWPTGGTAGFPNNPRGPCSGREAAETLGFPSPGGHSPGPSPGTGCRAHRACGGHDYDPSYLGG